MKFIFSKMHGAGNDFIVADERAGAWPRDAAFIKSICDRHRGAGADGLILLSGNAADAFRMDFFNSDGSSAEMCGNGLRCAALFCSKYMSPEKELRFLTGAGELKARICSENTVRIQIPLTEDFSEISLDAGKRAFRGGTGVPHVVIVADDVEKTNVYETGRTIRFDERFAPAGTNVNFIEIPSSEDLPVPIRTYERGVEGETNACGTGIAAAAVCLCVFCGREAPLDFITRDKDILKVDLQITDNIVSGIELTGPAVEVFGAELKSRK